MRQIILASASKTRKEIVKSLGVPFKIVPAKIDEQAIRDDNLAIQAEKIARAKAEVVAKDNMDSIIIAADTFCAIGDFVLEKPKDLIEAREMLLLQSGKTGTVYTGFCYIDREADIDVSKTVECEYTFRGLQNSEIETYVATYPVLTWSAAFNPSNTVGMSLIANMNGSPTSFTYGLPAEELIPLLRRSGIEV